MNTSARRKNGDTQSLRPCPFCHHRHVRMTVGVGAGFRHHMISCEKCQAIVSFMDKPSAEDAAYAWNR